MANSDVGETGFCQKSTVSTADLSVVDVRKRPIETSKLVRAKAVRKSSPIANFFWMFTGNGVYAACQWTMLMVMAKLGTPEMVGLFALAQTITIPIYSLTNLQLRSVLVTDAAQQHDTATYLLLRRLSNFVALSMTVLVVMLSGYDKNTALVILLFGVAKAFESVSDIYHGLIQRRELMSRIAISLVLKGVLSVVAVVMAVYYFSSVLWGVVAMAVAWGLVLVVYDRPIASHVVVLDNETLDEYQTLSFRFDWCKLQRLLIKSWPLGCAFLLVMLNPHIPRYLLEKSVGRSELGIFAALTHLTLVGYQVVGALGQAASPRIAQCYHSGDVDGVRRWMKRMVTMSLILGVFAMLATFFVGPQILTLAYRSEYAVQSQVFIVLVGAAAISWIGSVLGFWLTATQVFRAQIFVQAAGVVLTLVASSVMISRYGLMGAAWTQVIGNALITVSHLAIAVFVMRSNTQSVVLSKVG